MDDDVMVESTAAVHTDPTVEPAAVPPPGRSRLAVVMLVIAGVLLVAAIPLAVMGFSARSEASDERTQTAAAQRSRNRAEEMRVSTSRDRLALEELVRDMPVKVMALETAASDLADAQQRYTDTTNHGAAVFNAGDAAGSAGVFQQEAQPILDELTQKNQAAEDALRQALELLEKLRESQ